MILKFNGFWIPWCMGPQPLCKEDLYFKLGSFGTDIAMYNEFLPLSFLWAFKNLNVNNSLLICVFWGISPSIKTLGPLCSKSSPKLICSKVPMKIFLFNETLPPLFLYFVLFIRISNTSVPSFWVCNLFSAGSHGFFYWKAHKAHPPSGKLEEKANPTHPIQAHITQPVSRWWLVLTLDIFWSRQFLNSHRLTYSPTMAPQTPLPTLPPLTPSHLLTHATPTWAFSGTDFLFAVSQVAMKTPNPQKQVS